MNDESVLKVRTEKAYQRLMNRNKNHLFQGVASVNTLPSEIQLVSTQKQGSLGTFNASHKRA